MTTTDTPVPISDRNERCPNCEARLSDRPEDKGKVTWMCFSWRGARVYQSYLCREITRRIKAEAEVERLRSTMRSFILVSPIEAQRMEKIEAEAERLRGQLTRAVSIAGVLLADIEDFHEGDSDDEWTRRGWNDSRISKYLLQGLREEIK